MIGCKERKSGFTIVELLAVIVLMAIVTVIGFVGVRALLKSGKNQTMVTKTELVLKNAVSLADETSSMFNGCYCKIDNKWKDCRVITVQDLIDQGSYTTTEKCENNADCIKNDLYDFRGDSDVEFKEESLNNEKIVLYKRNNQYVAEFATTMKDETLRSQGCSYSNIKASEIKLSAPTPTESKQYVSLDNGILYYADDIYYNLKFESGLPITSIKYCLTTGESCDQFNKTIVAKANQYTYTGKIDIKVSNPVRLCVQALDELKKVTTGCSDLFYYDPSKIETLDVSTPICYVNGTVSTENCPVTGTNRYIADYITTDFSSTKERSKYNYYKKIIIENSVPNNFEVSINSTGIETNSDGKYLNEFTQPNRDDINGTITVRAPEGQEYKPLKYDITNTVTDTSEHQVVNSKMPEMNVTIKYKVIYDPNGGTGTMTPSIFRYYNTVNLTRNTFTRIGYTYKGWSKQKSGNLEANSGVNYSNGTVDEVTLYAQWEANKYTVTFDRNTGDIPSYTTKVVTYDSAYGTLPTISKTGYTFAGWWTAASGGTRITENTIVKTPNNHTLYAHWAPNKYTVTFDRNTGNTPSQTTKEVIFDSAYGTLPTITKTGYTFAGWWTATSGGTQITENTIVKTPNNHTLYARWTANKYTVTLTNTNATTAGTTSVTATYDSANLSSGITNPKRIYTITFKPGSPAATLSATSATSTWTFTGWWTATSGGTKVIGTDGKLIASVSGYTNASKQWIKAGNATLYAQWSGGTITVPTPTRTGYTCKLPTVTNPPTANATYTATCTDIYPPTITCTKSNTGTTAGVTVTCTCKDNGSGVVNCADKAVTATASTTSTKTGVKSSQTYTVKDASGNTASTTVTVTAQGQIRTKSCTAGKRCEAAGCQTWKNCAHSECGCKTWKSCENPACGVASYKRCASAGCETYNSCRSAACGCQTYNSCQSAACGTEKCNCVTKQVCAMDTGFQCVYYKPETTCGTCNKTCRTPACGCQTYSTCRTGACGCQTYKRGSQCGVESYKTCATEACGCKTWKTCRTSGCGCETYNQNIAKCGCSTWGGWSAWTNSNSCTAGESSNHSTTTECRTLYS